MMRYLSVVLILLLANGCGSSKIELAPVSGTVMFNGKPLKKGKIVFESPNNRPANGLIEDGKIVELYTTKPGDGVPLGSHKIAVFALEVASESITTDPSQSTNKGQNYMGTGKSLIPDKYNDPEQSGLTAEIKAGEENTVTLELFSTKK